MRLAILIGCALVGLSSEAAFSQERIEFGFWTQLWFQHAQDGKHGNADLNDFIARRAYLSIKGQPSDRFGFFTHVAVDRLGQEGLDYPAIGLGSGLAFRDLWVTLHLHKNIDLQVGRMYVPLTRNYGVTSTKALLTTDLSSLQGGVRGSIFYTSKVGRDDGIVLWGTPADGRLQYRLMVSEGAEGEQNPEDNPRVVGRLAVYLLDPETTWFNKGTYLGERKILAIGAAFDSQHDLAVNDMTRKDNLVWTVDVFVDHPVNSGAITVESAYIHIRNAAQAHNLSSLAAGDDASLFYLQSGYLLPTSLGGGRLQPYMRFETAQVSEKEDTHFWTGGLNYYLHGHNGKISLDYTRVDQADDQASQGMFTAQITVGL